MRKVALFAIPMAVLAVLLAGWLHQLAPVTDLHAATAAERTATVTDVQVERQIAEILVSSYETGQPIDEDPRLWELVGRLQPDQTVVLGE